MANAAEKYFRELDHNCIQLARKRTDLESKIKRIVDKIHHDIIKFLKDVDQVFYSELHSQSFNNMSPSNMHLLNQLRHNELIKKIATEKSKQGGTVVKVNESWTTKHIRCCNHVHNDIGRKKIINCRYCHHSMPRDLAASNNLLLFVLTRSLSLLIKIRDRQLLKATTSHSHDDDGVAASATILNSSGLKRKGFPSSSISFNTSSSSSGGGVGGGSRSGSKVKTSHGPQASHGRAFTFSEQEVIFKEKFIFIFIFFSFLTLIFFFIQLVVLSNTFQ